MELGVDDTIDELIVCMHADQGLSRAQTKRAFVPGEAVLARAENPS